jgi:EmrB/QacA subfamily drug resistance transporter
MMNQGRDYADRRPQPPGRPYLVLAICCMSLFLVTMDVTIVNVALPSIGRDFHASIDGLQWCVDGYTLVVASFLMLAGSTADRVGRRRTFQTGLTLFTLGSLLCSLAPSNLALVLCRVLQACGGAMLNPVAMSIITNTFLDPPERARAIGIWGAVTGISLAVGPILGGVLTQTVGWRSVFWVNVPIGVLAFVLTARFVPESRAAHPRRPDPQGQAYLVLTLAALTATLIEAPHVGWGSPVILSGFALALAGLLALVHQERRRTEPLIDLRFFRSIPLSSATLIAALMFSCYSGSLFLFSLYLQEVRGFKAASAGLCLLPTALATLICSPLSGRWVAAGNTRAALITAGLSLAASGALLTRLSAQTSIEQLLLAYGLFGVGMGFINAPITNTAVSGIPRAQAGLAAGLTSTSRQVGATLGIALAGTFAGVARGGAHFTGAAHGAWWLVVGCGLTVAAVGYLVTGERARRSAERMHELVGEAAAARDRPSP